MSASEERPDVIGWHGPRLCMTQRGTRGVHNWHGAERSDHWI